MDINEAAGVLKALGHPDRLRILSGLLRNQNCNVGDMAEKLDLPQSTVSQHLAQLRTRGLIAPKKDGTSCCYAVTDARVRKLLKILEA